MDQEPGGFLAQTGLPSPPPSTSSRATSTLPHPRTNSLRPGSNKEDLIRRYVEESLLIASRRYVKKYGNPNPDDTVTGFKSMGEVCRELDSVVNVLWKSGTPALQVPFLLAVASDFTRYVRSFTPSPRPTFELLRKLDHCFASLLCGQDIESKETLPGFENGLRAGMTITDMVRCRSLVEQTRVLMVEIMSSADLDEDEDEDEDEYEYNDEQREGTDNIAERSTDVGEDSAAEASCEDGHSRWDIDEERLYMDAARTYENTIIRLGERLGDPLGDENKADDLAVCARS